MQPKTDTKAEERKIRELLSKHKLNEAIDSAYKHYLMTGIIDIKIEEQQCNEK